MLRMGKENIVQYLVQLPKTQHDLSSFTVDLIKFEVAFYIHLLNIQIFYRTNNQFKIFLAGIN